LQRTAIPSWPAGEHARSAGVGDCALALIADGRIFDSYFSSIGDLVDDSTLFRMALVLQMGPAGRKGI
jgi:hypothetical protein